MQLAAQPLATSEFVAVDVETNGRAGELCELTEVGCVLIGGGELHDSYESLVRVERPLSRGIERFTGITQAMVDAAPPPERALRPVAELLARRVLVAHSASFDRRVLRQAFERAGVEWPDPPAICTLSMARRYAPLSTRRKLVPLAESLGIEVEGAHRALVDARTCARIFSALFPRLCASAATVGEALILISPRRRPRRERRAPVPRERRPDLTRLPDDPGVYVFRDERGRPLYVGKSVSLRSRARAHFCAPAGWTERAEIVDYRRTNSELGALVLENRLIKTWQPPGNVKLRRTDGYVYLRCRLDIEYPVLEVADEPAAGRAVNIGPLRGRAAAQELADQLSSLFRLRHCGRRLRRRDHPSVYGQMGRCLSPCLLDLDPNLYRRQLDEALDLFDTGEGEAGTRLLGHLEAEMRAAAAGERFERAETLRRRHERLATVLARLDGVLEATHSRSRLVLAGHPVKERWDAFWLVAGRIVDWGPLTQPEELGERSRAALASDAARRSRTAVGADEVDEVRIVGSWLAGHDSPWLGLEAAADESTLATFLERAGIASLSGVHSLKHGSPLQALPAG